jgi:hypothetical protein
LPIVLPHQTAWQHFLIEYFGFIEYFDALTTTSNNLKHSLMGNLLYIIAVILIIIWAIGYFGYAAGGIIHILLVIAIIAILLKVIRRAD